MNEPERPLGIIIRGLPGSGKSTFYRKNFPNMFMMESDMFNQFNGKYMFTNDRQFEALQDLDAIFERIILRDHYMDLCLCGVFARGFNIAFKIDRMLDRGYNVKVYTLTTQYQNIHEVPKDVFESMKKDFASKEEIYSLIKNHMKDKLLEFIEIEK